MAQLTKRAILYVGFDCDLRCPFCYYAYAAERPWHPLEQCLTQARMFREDYGDRFVDISGGEPTLYPPILQLVEACRAMGLAPSLITNARSLSSARRVRALRKAGVADFLCSVHAFGSKYDQLVRKTDGWRRLSKALGNLAELRIPFRVNCVLTTYSMFHLLRIAQYTATFGAKVINFISYNPFYDWEKVCDQDFQATHARIAPYLREALDWCNEAGLEANVRYYPFCLLTGHEETGYNFSQLSYDPGEWHFESWYSALTDAPADKLDPEFLAAHPDGEDRRFAIAKRQRANLYGESPACASCALGEICDGLTRQYLSRFGDGELRPQPGDRISDPAHFIRGRNKYLWEVL